MNRWASAVIAVVVLGHVTALAAQRELWPFSHYPMYARPQTEWAFQAHRLYGIAQSGEEVALGSGAEFAPFGPAGLSNVLDDAATDPARLDRTLRSLLSWYDSRRPGLNAPPLRGLRLYRTTYGLSRELDPRRRDRAAPVSRVLVAELAR